MSNKKRATLKPPLSKPADESSANVSKMKPTAQRLSEVYCRPTTDGEWDELDIQNPLDRKEFPFVMMQGSTAWQVNYTFNRTEIPVSQFIDLIQDAICAWRLEDGGFKQLAKGVWSWSNDGHQILISFEPELCVMVSYSDQGMIPFDGVKTYTQLLTLIELIGELI